MTAAAAITNCLGKRGPLPSAPPPPPPKVEALVERVRRGFSFSFLLCTYLCHANNHPAESLHRRGRGTALAVEGVLVSPAEQDYLVRGKSPHEPLPGAGWLCMDRADEDPFRRLAPTPPTKVEAFKLDCCRSNYQLLGQTGTPSVGSAATSPKGGGFQI